ncbi:MAG: hypothetical protein Q9198_007875, partial [Flavoplaca austrocitrina]
SVQGLPFTSTTTASPAVSQISDGQVQAAAGPPSIHHSSNSGSGSGSPPLPNQDDPMGGSSVLTVRVTNSMGSMITRTTAVSNRSLQYTPKDKHLYRIHFIWNSISQALVRSEYRTVHE